MIFPLEYPFRQQLYVVDGDVWQTQDDDEIEIVEDTYEDHSDVKYNFVDNNYSSMFQLSLAGDSDDSDKINENTPLPEFSDFVRNHLVENNLSAIWGLFIDECAKYYYGKFPNIQNSSEYQTIGRKMYENFPSIAYEGKEPWSYFCKSLSQKIRHIKWKNKKKNSLRGQCSPKTRSPSRRKSDYVTAKLRSIKRNADRKHISGKYYKVALNELQDGWYNGNISEERVKSILKHTFKSRHHWVNKLNTKRLKPIVEEYPCFLVGKYVVHDFLLLTNKDDSSELLKKMETLFSAVGSMMMPQVSNVGDTEAIKVLKFMEDQTAFAKDKKGCFSKSIVVLQSDVPDADLTDLLKTEESIPPYIVISTIDNKITSSYVVGDDQIIETEATSLYEALLVLIATYCTFNLKYPKCFSQVLGLLQTYATGEVYTGIKSYNYSTFIKKVDKKISRIT